MRRRLGFLAAIVALIVAGSALWEALFHTPPSLAAAPTPAGRELTVVGVGVARGKPDLVFVQFGVQTQGDTAKAALRENTAKMQALMARLKELKIPESAIQTSNLNIWSQQEGPGSPVRYQASNTVTVRLDDVARAGTVLEQVVDAGANSVVNLNFTVAKPDALEQAAREQAIVSARTRATGMAKASGATLGQLLRISEGGALPPSLPPTGGGAGGAQAGGEPPISPGEYVVNAYVQVTFELK